MKQICSHAWEARTVGERVNIRSRSGQYPITTTQVTKEVFTVVTGKFEIEIDIDGIARMLMGRAAHGKSGRSVFLHGLCKAKRLSAVPGAQRTKEHPVNLEHYEIIER